jgi:FAD/FMN-containing dehydrogenase
VRSLDIVTSGERGPRLLRIERKDGPTEEVPDSEPWQLVADDDLFNAAAVGMGCMGVIYAVTLEVCPKFRLTEVRRVSTWEEVRDQLPSGSDLRGTDHWELFVNPYAGSDGLHKCLVTTRTRTPADADPTGGERHRPLIPELLSSVPVITPFVLNEILDHDPEGTSKALDFPIERLRDTNYTDSSYKVFNIGNANLLPAYSSEIGIPLVGDKPRRAVEQIFQIAEQRARIGNTWHSSPFSLRFVRQSPCFLSMMHGADTMMIELIMQKDTEGGFELLAAHENALYRLGGRPHWGQVNFLTEPVVRDLYPGLEAWTAARNHLDPEGAFDSPFTQRVGLSRPVVEGR